MVDDLSRYHHPLSTLFPQFDEWAQYRLSEDQIEFYREHGYLGGIKMLDDVQLRTLREELAELVDPAHPGHELFYEFNANESADPQQILFHALGAWRIKRGLHDLLWHPAFVVPASQLLGGAVRFWHDQIFYKPARHGGIVIWHQDYSYWTRTVPMAHVSCWIGLDDSTRENGCVHYVPGSHRWQLLPRASFANSMDAVLDSLTPSQRVEFKPVAIELKAGECSYHHPLMVHGSYANTTDRAAPCSGAQCLSRWRDVRIGCAATGRRASDPVGREDGRAVLSAALSRSQPQMNTDDTELNSFQFRVRPCKSVA